MYCLWDRVFSTLCTYVMSTETYLLISKWRQPLYVIFLERSLSQLFFGLDIGDGPNSYSIFSKVPSWQKQTWADVFIEETSRQAFNQRSDLPGKSVTEHRSRRYIWHDGFGVCDKLEDQVFSQPASQSTHRSPSTQSLCLFSSPSLLPTSFFFLLCLSLVDVWPTFSDCCSAFPFCIVKDSLSHTLSFSRTLLPLPPSPSQGSRITPAGPA